MAALDGGESTAEASLDKIGGSCVLGECNSQSTGGGSVLVPCVCTEGLAGNSM